MCLWINNPPAPGCEPTTGGMPGRPGQPCGRCKCVPRYWKLTCGLISPPFDLAYGRMAGSFILSRDLAAFRKDDQQACEWVAAVVLDPQTPPPGQTIAYWSLYWGSYDTGLGTLSSTGWIVVANMATPQTPNDIDAWIAEPVSELIPTAEPPFKCLSTNVLNVLDGGLGFPNTVTVEPFWP